MENVFFPRKQVHKIGLEMENGEERKVPLSDFLSNLAMFFKSSKV